CTINFLILSIKFRRKYSLEGKMNRSYNKLWKLMIDKKMNKTQLREAARITSNAMAKLGKDESVPVETLEKICRVLDCTIDDIMDINKDNKE
ncbi:helix-turn-helix domain-containing protein, partial [Coprococcus comes]